MTKLNVFVLVGLLVCYVNAKAQWTTGVLVGYDYNVMSYDVQWAKVLHYTGHVGSIVEVPVAYHLNKWLNISSGLSVMEKGDVLNYKTEINNRKDVYLTVPAMVEFVLNNSKVKKYVDIGGYFSYWMSSYSNGIALMPSSAETFVERKIFVSGVDNRIEVGLVAGIGVGYEWNKWMWIATARYYHALSNQYDQPEQINTPAYNRTITFQVGVVYSIK